MSGKHHNIEEVQKMAKLKGGVCLSKTYKRATDKLKFKCSEGHLFEKDFKRILHRNEWCQKCSRNTSEEICRFIFESLLDVKFEKNKFNYNGHTLELDGYNEKNKIAFEYNGKQHYEITSYIKTEKELSYRKYLDGLKVEYCKISGINLFIIPYTIKNDELLNYIKKLLKIKKKNSIDIYDFINNYSYYKKRKLEVEKIMNDNGGKLLKFNFNNVEVECNNNHKWKSTHSLIKKGHLCRICADKKHQRKFIDIVKILKENEIICLSNEDSYKDSGKSILEFRCNNGHIFKDTVDYVLERIAGKNNNNNRRPCQLCNRPSQDKALNKISNFGLTLLHPLKYKNKTEEVEWVCKNNHIQKNKLKNLIEAIRRGGNCCKLC